MNNISLPSKRVLAIAAILALSLLAPGTAAAQSRPIVVDLAVEFYESGGGADFVLVTNNSEVDVHNVVVDIEFDPPVVDDITLDEGAFVNGKWTIPRITGPGGSAELRFTRGGTPPPSNFFRHAPQSSRPRQERRGGLNTTIVPSNGILLTPRGLGLNLRQTVG